MVIARQYNAKTPAITIVGVLIKAMKYIFKKIDEETKKEIEIEVTPEIYGWGVVYKDGSELKQFADDGVFHQFAEIKQEEVAYFVMFKLEDLAKRIDLVAEGKQIFHFYRNFVFEHGGDNERHVKVYCFGWKDKTTGATSYNFILPDDRMVVADQDIDLTKFSI